MGLLSTFCEGKEEWDTCRVPPANQKAECSIDFDKGVQPTSATESSSIFTSYEIYRNAF